MCFLYALRVIAAHVRLQEGSASTMITSAQNRDGLAMAEKGPLFTLLLKKPAGHKVTNREPCDVCTVMTGTDPAE